MVSQVWAFISLAAPADDLLERAAAEVLPRVTGMKGDSR